VNKAGKVNMRKLICFWVLLITTSISAWAQSDSVTLVNASWKKQKLARGVWWKHYGFTNNLFSSSQYINIVEIRRRRKIFDLGYEATILKNTSDFGKETKAMVALNGTFFDIKNGGSVDYIRSDGKVINKNRLDKSGARTRHQKAAIILRKKRLKIQQWDNSEDWEKTLDGEDVMLSGPLLIYQSTSLPPDTTSFSKSRHPRTAVAITKKRILLITVDGRDAHAAGMSLTELSQTMKWLGAVDGLNLDGGGSTTLWIYNQPENGVVSYPSDNKIWDHAGERKVANVLLLKK
jgi:exopolysaccharide biosynthesis protein